MAPQILPTPQTVGAYSQSLPVNQDNDGTVAKVPWYKTRTCKVIMVGLGILAAAGAVAAFLASSFVAAGVLGAAGLICLGIPLYQAVFSPKPLAQRNISSNSSVQQKPTAIPQPAQASQITNVTPQPAFPQYMNYGNLLSTHDGHDTRHYDFKNPSMNLISPPIQPNTLPAQPRIVWHADGAMGVTDQLLSSNPSKNIAIIVAGNHGKPGGGIQNHNYEFTPQMASHTNHKTQEESLIASWLINECGNDPRKKQTLFQQTIQYKWGFHPNQNHNTTIQGVDYTSTRKAQDYGDAWSVNNIPVSQQSPLKAGFIFVAGPNINSNLRDRSGTGSMARTLNQKAYRNYNFFLDCDVEALVAAFKTAILEGRRTVLVPQLSCGVYAKNHGKHGLARKDYSSDLTGKTKRGFIHGDFMKIVLERALNTHFGGFPIRNYFTDVIVPMKGNHQVVGNSQG